MDVDIIQRWFLLSKDEYIKEFGEFLEGLSQENLIEVGWRDIQVARLYHSSDEEQYFYTKNLLHTRSDDITYNCCLVHQWTEIEDNIPWMVGEIYSDTYFELKLPNSNVIQAIDKSRKDYCFDCKSDKIVWKAMAGLCGCCGKVLIG